MESRRPSPQRKAAILVALELARETGQAHCVYRIADDSSPIVDYQIWPAASLARPADAELIQWIDPPSEPETAVVEVTRFDEASHRPSRIRRRFTQ